MYFLRVHKLSKSFRGNLTSSVLANLGGHHNHLVHRKLSDSIKIAVIGSGPAGFYTTQALLKNPRVRVDIYEKAPVPFGLIRFGVAPDHPEVKNVISTFNKIAANERVTFNGNVAIGSQINLQQLREAYHIVVLCYGSTEDRQLGIEGEQLSCVVPAKRFVGWYNGVPEDKDLNFSLDQERVVIIGQGNVALDCARILLTSVDNHLKNTDITDYALEKLSSSQVKQVHVVGRRGPLQAAFKTKELREMTKMPEFSIHLDPEQFKTFLPPSLVDLPRPRKRLVDLMCQIAQKSNEKRSVQPNKQCFLEFLQSPLKIERRSESNLVHFGLNKFQSDPFSEQAKVELTDRRRVLEFGFLLRSIGYRAVSIDPAIPIDERSGVIQNVNGKISALGEGVYCSGWAATGATGVILGTMNSALEIGRHILQDIEHNEMILNNKPGRESILLQLKQQNVKVVTFADWQKIDELERQRGQSRHKPREKFVNTKDILDAI